MLCNQLSHSDLVQACLTSDEEAWKEFTDRYDQVISLAVLRTARRWGDISKPLLEDLRGDVYRKICDNNFALLRNFEFRTDGSIYGYLKKVATNAVHDYFRHSPPRPGRDVPIEDLYQSADPPKQIRVGSGAIERNVLLREVEEVLWEVTGSEGERDRTIFWLYYRQRFTAEEIAELEYLCLTVKGVESVIHRITNAVRDRLSD